MKVFRDGICGEPVLVGECAVELPPGAVPRTIVTREKPISAFDDPAFSCAR